MIGLATALWLSKPLRWAVLGLALLAGYEGWKAHQRSIGAERFAANVERKANEDAQKSDAVRADVVAGKRGVRDPAKRDPGN